MLSAGKNFRKAVQDESIWQNNADTISRIICCAADVMVNESKPREA